MPEPFVLSEAIQTLESLIQGAPVTVIHDGVADVEFHLASGWVFNVFFKHGGPHYVDWIQPPTGERVEFESIHDIYGYLFTNLCAWEPLREKLLALARACPNWGYG